MNELDALRDGIARITRRGVGMPMAGGLYWLAIALIGTWLSGAQAAFAMFVGTGLVFPLGWWLTRALGGDLFSKGHPLTALGGTLNAVQFFYWPVLIVVFWRDPMLVPFTMGVLFVSHFLPYGWFYRSRGYTMLGIVGPALAMIVQWAAPTHAFVAIPLAEASVYAVAVAMVLRENNVQTLREAA